MELKQFSKLFLLEEVVEDACFVRFYSMIWSRDLVILFRDFVCSLVAERGGGVMFTSGRAWSSFTFDWIGGWRETSPSLLISHDKITNIITHLEHKSTLQT